MTANEDRRSVILRLVRQIRELERANPQAFRALKNLGLFSRIRKTKRTNLNPTTSCH